ncbi:glycosyl transferase family protein [Marimonas arenosa]|uniref:Glycosyl transferase family protein n=1 Tax=Marimonas arenosa TaxID=1795305 RepID=A0AAE3WA50_9RHOB|nr:glycosyl transferase family protein [Marimonas arenosa]MDQ2089371.1 glycosyl transferase family protein [Marimonas arenosa]
MNAHTPHPFSKFVAILGRGKTKQRHLTLEESVEAMEMLLRDEAVPEQIGAFLMLLRLKEEAPSEIAGFAMGTRRTFDLPDSLPSVDIDWSSYAGKRIQLPWYMLSVFALVNAGYSVLLHGTEGHTPGRVYTSDVLKFLGMPMAASLQDAADQIRESKFAYVPLEVMSRPLREMINLRPILGLRSPVHSFSRMLNPFNARTVMVGIFHRGFMDIHAGAAQLMGMENFGVFRGEGGEVERRPNKPTQVWMTHGADEPVVETFPQLLPEGHQPPDEEMKLERLIDVWTGAEEDAYATATIEGTIAVTLRTMGKAGSVEEAEDMGRALWAARDKGFLPYGK